MIGISTSWRSGSSLRGEELVEELLSLDVDGLELEYRIPPALFADMREALAGCRVFSIHNYFPVPDILLPSQGSGDAFLLSSLDADEREKAVDFTIRSLRAASELGAGCLVLHLGEVDCGERGRGLVKIFKEKGGCDDFNTARSALLEERQSRAEAFLDCLYSSLEGLFETATETGVLLCIENRYYPHQIPSFDEVEKILKRFEGAPIRYWHDVGHAVVQDRLGLVEHGEWLKKYGGDLAGMHLHDVRGLRDHLAPGEGDAPLEEIMPFLSDDTTAIVEVHQDVEAKDLERGIEKLRAMEKAYTSPGS